MNFPYHNTHSNHALEDKMNISTIFEEEQQLLQIKKRLFQEVNAFRHRNSLPEFYEDHGLSRILQNMLISNPNQVTVESITQHSQPKIASSDIQIINSMRQFSNLSLSKENPMSSLEHLYSEMLNQMMHVTYKEKFVDKKIHNMTLHLGFEYSQAFLIVIFSQTILSVDRIYIEGDHYYITGGVNNPNFSVFILIIKFKDYDIVISPNKMSYDFINHIFKIKFDKRHFSMSMNSAPDLCFYVKAGANSVKYGHGTDLTYQDVVKMSSILTFAYSTPLILVESTQLHPKTFLKNSLTRPNLYKNKPSIVFQTDSKQGKNSLLFILRFFIETPVTKNIRNFVNSPIPKFNLNNHLQKDILSPINEESTGHSKKVKVVHNTKELRLPPTFAHIKQLNSMKNIENKENVQRQPMIEEVNRHHTESNKFQLNSINNKMNNKLFNEKIVDPKTLNFFNNFTPQTSFKSTPSENNNRQDLVFSSGNFDKKQLNPFNCKILP